jgi:hypothetical protein
VYRAQELADRINRLPNDGGAVMAELSMELTVLTGRRSFDVPFEPVELRPIIEQYDVRYIVIDETSRLDAARFDPDHQRAMRYQTYQAILDDPVRFQEIARVQDSGGGVLSPDMRHTYRIVRVMPR